MNFGKSYSRSIGASDLHQQRSQEVKITPDGVVVPKEEAEKAVESAVSQQVKTDWIASTPTQELIRELANQQSELVEQAMNHAVSAAVNTQAKDLAIQCLVKAYQIGEIAKAVKSPKTQT